MALINLQEVTLSYGGLPILEKVNMQIDAKERVCLIGRNGEGKSSLMKLISEEVEADSGQIIRQQGLKVSRLRQQVPKTINGTIFDVVASGLGDLHELLSQHHSISHELNTDSSPALLARLEKIHHRLDTEGGWQAQQQVDTVLSRLQLAADTPFNDLSGGLKRRVLLAQALVGEPDLLLLDEPTNHLDIESITWLEEFLLNYKSALLFVTHDRTLLRHLATRIIEIDRGQATSWPGDYDTYLRRKTQMLEVETDQRAKFDKKLAQEEIWIRKGIKARRTRDEGRVRALMDMRREHAARREQAGKARMQLMEAGLSGKLVVEAKHASFSYAGKTILKDVSTTILRGDKIGIIGPNGVGKTTLLRLLLGELSQQDGSIKLGANLAPVYFDQHRNVLDEEKSVADNVSDGNDTVLINDRPKHIIGYLQDFLFAPDRARSPVKILSGGERNRLLLAKLFAKPSNVLILDEPTNDLDVETLDLLEEIILNYKGTVLLVSHDRAFLNNVVTSTLVFEGDGIVSEYAGGYDDWLLQRKPSEDAKETKIKDKGKGQTKKSTSRKLTFKEKKELTALPKQIEELESEQEDIFARMAAPDFYQRDKTDISKAKTRVAELERQLPKLYKRWEDLEAIVEQD